MLQGIETAFDGYTYNLIIITCYLTLPISDLNKYSDAGKVQSRPHAEGQYTEYKETTYLWNVLKEAHFL